MSSPDIRPVTAYDIVDIAHTTDVYDWFTTFFVEDGWTKRTKEQNFRSLTEGLERLSDTPLAGSSILDVGCGTGDLFPFTMKQGVASYVGIDINSLSLERAQTKYTNGNFIFADIIRGDVEETSDFVIASGTMTVKQRATDNYSFLAALVSAMWQRTGKGLAFNFLTDENAYEIEENGHFFHYNSAVVAEICKDIAPNGIVIARDAPFIDYGEIFKQTNIFIIPSALSIPSQNGQSVFEYTPDNN